MTNETSSETHDDGFELIQQYIKQFYDAFNYAESLSYIERGEELTGKEKRMMYTFNYFDKVIGFIYTTRFDTPVFILAAVVIVAFPAMPMTFDNFSRAVG